MSYYYAGEQAIEIHRTLDKGAGKSSPVELDDGREYLVCLGRYVPHYAPRNEETLDRDIIAIDLARRFFESAELGINIRRNYIQLQQMLATYNNLPAGTNRRTAWGALCVGAMVARMEKLAHLLLRDGKILAQPAEQGDPEPLEEINEHFNRLLRDEDLVKCVRRRGNRTDIDGVIEEMVSELRKPSEYNLKKLYQDRAYAIGATMNAIDDIDRSVQELITLSTYLDRSDIGTRLHRLSLAARKRVGIRSDDVEAYNDSAVALKEAENDMMEKIRERGQGAYGEALSNRQILNLVRQGMDLILDMAQIRTPRTESLKYFCEKVAQEIDLRRVS